MPIQKPTPNPNKMATHRPASVRTPGGAMRTRKNSALTKSRFSIYPLMAAGGLCAAIALIFPQGGQPRKIIIDQKAAALSRSAAGPETKSRERLDRPAQEADPARALVRALELENRMERDSRVRDLLFAWAAQDAEAALDWVMTLEDPAMRSHACATVCLTVAENDPRRAVVLALAHGVDEEAQGGLLESLTMQWCDKESKAVLDWAREQPPGEWRERLLSRVSYVLSKSDPIAAAEVVSSLEPGSQQDEAAMAVLHQWAQQDPSAALKWAEGFGNPTLHQRALEEISNLKTWVAARDHE